MPTEKQSAFFQLIKDQAANQAYSNVTYWLESKPIGTVLDKIKEKRAEIVARHPGWKEQE